MTAPINPMHTLVKRGNEMLDERTLDDDKAMYDEIALFFANAANGMIPIGMRRQLRDAMRSANEAVANGEDLPSLGSSSSVDGMVNPEHRALLRAVEKGEIELDSQTGLPKQPAADDELANTLLGPIEKLLGINQVTLGNPAARTKNAEEAVKQLKASAADNDGSNSEQLDKIAKAAKVTRKDGESDEDFAKRIADEVTKNANVRAEVDKVLDGLVANGSPKKSPSESHFDYLNRMFELDTSSGTAKKTGGRWSRGTRP